MSSASGGTNAPVKRACDNCHRRKVKCISEATSPCKNCAAASLVCTYHAIPQKKGPKGIRAKVISEIRENQRNAQLVPGLPPELGIDGRIHSIAFAPTPGLLPAKLAGASFEFFLSHVYHSQPVLDRQKVQDAITNMDRSAEAYCMIAALCAYVIIQANMEVSHSLLERPEMTRMSSLSIGHTLLEESVRVRNGYDYHEKPTHMSVLTSWFYCGSYHGLAKENSAWAYLREATTQAQLIGLQNAETHKHDPLDISRKRVLYWLLLITERTYALHKHRPISLFAHILPPSLGEVPNDRSVAVGLEIIINMYKLVDDTFINTWNQGHSSVNPSWIVRLQTQLAEAVPAYIECSEEQAVEIRVTQHWLKATVWQLSFCHGLIGNVPNEPCFTVMYLINKSRDLLSMAQQFAQHAMEIHGAGLVEKLFDIACCLTDAIAATSFSPDAFDSGPREIMSRFLTLISGLRCGHRYLPRLLAKLSDVLPNLPLPRSLNLPQSSRIDMSGQGAVPADVASDFSVMSNSMSSMYPSTEMHRRIAPTGTPGSFHTSQYPLHQAPIGNLGDLSLYDSTHGSTQSAEPAPRSSSSTPFYELQMAQQRRSQISGHHSQLPSTGPQQTHLQSQHTGVAPTEYDPHFDMQGYPIDPSMMYKQE